jgi:hypothetical protein
MIMQKGRNNIKENKRYKHLPGKKTAFHRAISNSRAYRWDRAYRQVFKRLVANILIFIKIALR